MDNPLLSMIARGIHDGDGLVVHSRRAHPITTSIIQPLPPAHRRGLIGVGIVSLISTLATAILFFVITYRLIFWRKHFGTYLGYNQYIILIYNLLIADLQESLGFLLSLYWVHQDKLYYDTPICFSQGWLLQIGDPASGLFVLAIAVHTFLTVLIGRKISHRTFVAAVITLWAFCLALPVIPTALYGRQTFAPTGPWCWIDESHPIERLWLHYFWIFVSEFGSILVYLVLFVYLRRRVAESAALTPGQTEHLSRLRRVTGYMVLYPLAYTVLSLPLAAGRMAAASGKKMNISYFCAAGAMISASGLADVIMYAFTRRALLLDSQDSYRDRTYTGQRRNHTTTITAEHPHTGRKNNLRRIYGLQSAMDQETSAIGTSSTENFVKDVELAPMGTVYQQTTIEVTHERVTDRDMRHHTNEGAGIPQRQSGHWYVR